jgi:hypothetical protein
MGPATLLCFHYLLSTGIAAHMGIFIHQEISVIEPLLAGDVRENVTL